MNGTQKRTAKKATATQGKSYDGFTDEERGAMKERAKELKAASGGAVDDAEAALLEKIAEMPEAERAMVERIHAIVKENAPELKPKLWYGMPGWAKDGKVVCFFQNAGKFKSRYSTFGFNDSANLDDGEMWPTAFALTKLTAAGEKQITALVKKAAS
ncbi:iron chaperone [Kribbella sp. NPDC049227]|uniref:iron chaperone n=1 Tax=Kribbella sp. NPDC049227 TaxID=3364113 RepID=UPI003712033F